MERLFLVGIVKEWLFYGGGGMRVGLGRRSAIIRGSGEGIVIKKLVCINTFKWEIVRDLDRIRCNLIGWGYLWL